jgi:hypothetical protein
MRSLVDLAAVLRGEDTLISEHVVEPTERATLGPLAAAGPRCASNPGEYSLVVESIREGYLLHYGAPRVVSGVDDDLALLAGDHLYALGLDRLARLGDVDAVRELADLISLCALLAAERAGDAEGANALWLASTVAVAVGGGSEHEKAKTAMRQGEAAAPSLLLASARTNAASAGLGDALDEAAEAIESAADGSS